ncbi:ECF-type sigma factor, partial [bacterium]|nr:ECF-type sigma factor [bacterium]
LIDYARSKKRIKRGGSAKAISLEQVDVPELISLDRSEELIQLDLALHRLEKEDPIKSELVKIRFFAGLTMPQAAETLGISLRTAERHWTFARVWLQEEIGRSIEL